MNDDKGHPILNHLLDWWAHPFTTTGSALNWVLFVGLLIIAVWMWNRVLATITD